MTPAKLAALPVAPVDTTAIPQGEFAPRIARPMSEPLAERFPELMLPGFGDIPADGVLLVESNPAFVEAFLVGRQPGAQCRTAVARTARPTGARPRSGVSGGTRVASTTSATSPRGRRQSALGSHVNQTAAMVLLVRGELVRRYPSVMVAAVPARWNADRTRSPRHRCREPATARRSGAGSAPTCCTPASRNRRSRKPRERPRPRDRRAGICC